MLPTQVSLLDIDDVEAFVAATLERFQRDSQIDLETDEREELLLEGISILYRLAAQYDPHRPGHTGPGRFNGYAAMFLPRKLGDEWHRRNGHQRVACASSGKRRWLYPQPAVSLEGEIARAEARGGRADHVEARLLHPDKWVPVAPAATQPSRAAA